MIIARGKAENSVSDKRGATFTGEVWADPVISADGEITIATIFFTPGARTFWHQHEGGQILSITAGHGLVCTFGESPRSVRAGDTIWVPPGERHWHGASAGSFMSHLAISIGTTRWADEVLPADIPPAAIDDEGAAR